MTKQQWVKKTREALGEDGHSLAQVDRLLQVAIGELVAALCQDDTLRIPGLGTFGTQRVAPRTGRNPQTGKPLKIPASTRVTFRPAQALKTAVQPKARRRKRAASPGRRRTVAA